MASSVLSQLGGGDLELAIERAKLVADPTNTKQLPEYSTGARSKIRINGQLLGAATDVSWNVEANMEPLQTIDSYMPLELLPHQCLVRAELSSFIHPDYSPASQHMFTTLQAYLHTPTATLEVVDRLGNLIFAARGSFTSVRGNISVKQVSKFSASFLGYYFRDLTQQAYSPVKLSLLDLLKQKGKARLDQAKDSILS
jgi:hypothetical protein